MRFLLLAFLALPAVAQSPSGRQVEFACDDEHCILKKEDWRWMMEQNVKARELLAKCGWKSS